MRACWSAWRATRDSRPLPPLAAHAALALARQYLPTAITLDIFLPDMLGWTVLNNLKLDPGHAAYSGSDHFHGGRAPARSCRTARFPTSIKPATTEGLEQCFDRIKDFVVPRTKRLLVVEDNEMERESIVELLRHDDIEIATVGTGAEAFEMLLDKAV